MGLDISYYSKATPVSCDRVREAFLDSDYSSLQDLAEENDWTIAYINPHFADRAAGLKDRFPYETEGGAGFHAGSYSGYNDWRRELAALVGIDDIELWWSTNPKQGPFCELLYFSDCEGAIGPVVSAKLAKDFDEWYERAVEHGDDWWRALYAKWRNAFTTAADTGFVDFH